MWTMTIVTFHCFWRHFACGGQTPSWLMIFEWDSAPCFWVLVWAIRSEDTQRLPMVVIMNTLLTVRVCLGGDLD